MNDDIAVICQMALQELVENLVEQIEEVATKEAPIKETATSAMPRARDWLRFEDEPFSRQKPGGFTQWNPVRRNKLIASSEGFAPMQQTISPIQMNAPFPTVNQTQTSTPTGFEPIYPSVQPATHSK